MSTKSPQPEPSSMPHFIPKNNIRPPQNKKKKFSSSEKLFPDKYSKETVGRDDFSKMFLSNREMLPKKINKNFYNAYKPRLFSRISSQDKIKKSNDEITYIEGKDHITIEKNHEVRNNSIAERNATLQNFYKTISNRTNRKFIKVRDEIESIDINKNNKDVQAQEKKIMTIKLNRKLEGQILNINKSSSITLTETSHRNIESPDYRIKSITNHNRTNKLSKVGSAIFDLRK